MNPSGERFINVSFLSQLKEYPSEPYTHTIYQCGNNTNNSSDALKHSQSRDENLFVVLVAVFWYRGPRLYNKYNFTYIIALYSPHCFDFNKTHEEFIEYFI